MNPTMLALLLALGLATGPSNAGYRIAPVAVNERGEVLFRTWRELNPEGAQAFRRADVGWLVVSANGLWREVPHAVAPDTARGDDGDSSRNAALRRQFEAPLAWDDPPASVAPLLREFGFLPRHAVSPSAGAGRATWSPSRLCVGRRCTAAVAQRTFGGLESETGQGSAMPAAFVRAGIALFHNTAPVEGEPSGAHFPLPPNLILTREEGLADLGFETWSVDGIAIASLRPPPPALRPETFRSGPLADADDPKSAGALLRRRFGPTDEDRVRLLKDGREALAATCDDFLALLRKGFAPGSTVEIHAAGSALVRCGGLELFSRMHASRERHLDAGELRAEILDVLPPCVGGMHASDDAHAAAGRASGNRVPWSRFDPEVKAVRELAGFAFGKPGEETVLTPLARGDLDGDGREDLLVASIARATQGTWAGCRLFVLTRRAGDPVVRVLAERALVRGSEICPLPAH